MTVVVPWNGSVTLGAVEGRDLATITSAEFSPSTIRADLPLVQVSRPFTVRERSMVTVSMYPVRGGSIYRTIDIQLAFSGGTSDRISGSAADPWFDRVLNSTAANFAQAKDWKAPRAEQSALSSAAAPGPFSSGATFFKIPVGQSGVYRITGAQLQAAGLSLTNVAGDSIRIFNGGGLQNEIQNNLPRPQFTEIAVVVNDGNDGRLDAGDEILFYGTSLNRWVYAPGSPAEFASHHYAVDNVYWLAVGGNFAGLPSRMTTIDGTVTGTYDLQLTRGQRYVHVEQDSLLSLGIDGHQYDFYEWYWTSASTVRLFVPTPGAVASIDNSIVIGDLTSYVPPTGYASARVNNVPVAWSCNPVSCTGTTSALTSGLNQIDLTLSPQNPGVAPGYFNWLNIIYTSLLEPAGDNLDVTLADTSARAQVVVNDQFSTAPLILSLDNAQQPQRVINAQRAGGKVTFEMTLSNPGPNHFYMTTPAQYRAPISITKVTPPDLRAELGQGDLIIVTMPQFVSALGDYIGYRQSFGRTIKVATVGDIMDNFSWGVYDPTAIRDFLKFAYENWTAPAPSAALFVGDGSYDYLNHLGSGVPNYVPSFNMPASYDSRAGDDNYVYFGSYGLLDADTSYPQPTDRGFDMMTARWPVKSASEIRTIVSKIKQYESAADLGSWRKDVVIVADDEYGNYNNEIYHVTDAILLENEHLPRVYHRDRIYLWDYPSVNRDKPAVNDAIVNAFNKGALVVNYIGHGNPDVWAHEHVLQRTTDLPRMTNRDRLPLVFAASCAIGFFDDPRREAMGEDFLGMANGGGIGVISAARLVYSSDNAAFNREVYDFLMYNSGLSIDEAVFAAKVARQYAGGTPFQRANDRAYLYFGDPYLNLGTPRLSIAFDQAPDSLTPLAVTTVAGRVVDKTTATVVRNGTVYVDVYDSDRPKTHRLESNPDIKVDYRLGGPSVYHGSASVTAGQFSFDFVTPLDINFGGKGARIELYAVLDSIDAVGLVDSLAIRDTAAVTTDSTGPAISYRVSGRTNFISGDHVTLGEQLELTIADPSGINLTSGLGHGITMEIDSRPDQMVNLSSVFAFDRDTYTTGTAGYAFAKLTPGDHTLKIKAWDNANNSSVVTLTVRVTADESLAINNLLNYPNPMSGSTTFYFELTSPADRFTLEIFTLSGRKIKTIDHFSLPADNYPNDAVSVGWDGRDAVGDRVATGVYIYKATAVPQVGGGRVESFGKVVVVN